MSCQKSLTYCRALLKLVFLGALELGLLSFFLFVTYVRKFLPLTGLSVSLWKCHFAPHVQVFFLFTNSHFQRSRTPKYGKLISFHYIRVERLRLLTRECLRQFTLLSLSCRSWHRQTDTHLSKIRVVPCDISLNWYGNLELPTLYPLAHL